VGDVLHQRRDDEPHAGEEETGERGDRNDEESRRPRHQLERRDDAEHDDRGQHRPGGAKSISPRITSSTRSGVARMASKVFW
jgi:hypothetical protein